MEIPGYAGNILYVDLTTGKTSQEPLDPELAKRFIGGWGINQWLAYDLIPAQVDPFAPENAIIIGTGPFNSTIIPGAAKMTVTSKFPLNNAFTTSGGGGRFPIMLKSAGYDHVVITGKASKPVYLKISEDKVELCDARGLWGKDQFETTDELRLLHEPCSILPIGQAGENLVKISVSLIDKGGSIGSGGLPAVMGSKNLKALVAVQGNHPIRVANRQRLHKLVDEMLSRITAYHLREEMMKGGSMAMTQGWRGGGGTITRNWTELEPTPPEAAANVAAIYEIHKRCRKKLACPSCPMADKDRIDLREGDSPMLTYDSALMALGFGARGALDAYTESLQHVDASNRYGICRLCFRGVFNLMVYLYEQGLISKEDTGGLELNGDFNTVLKLMKMTAFKEGFGEVLAEGMFGAAQSLGRSLDRHVVHIKGYNIVFDPRLNGLGTMEFEQIVNPSRCVVAPGGLGAASYNLGRPVGEWVRQARKVGISDEAIERIFTPTSFNQGRLTKHAEDWFSLFNCLGQCHRLYVNRFFNASTVAELYTAVTGIETTPSDLLEGAERAWNLYKVLNIRAGLGRKDDRAPEVWFQPLRGKDGTEYRMMDYFKSNTLGQEDVERLVEDYYDERGWDKKTGIPTPEKLKELGLEAKIEPGKW